MGSDGVVDDAEAVDFHVEGVAVTDVAAEKVLVFERAEVNRPGELPETCRAVQSWDAQPRIGE